MTNQPQPNQPQEIKIADNIPGGEYANVMQVNFNKDEFQTIFFTLLGNTGRVVSKIITNPGHFKRMANVMNEVIKKYEQQFGMIKEAESVSEKEIGFKA
ncbi:MAG: DUF3467 domain-containing protein [Patescibacteria group bacterium]|nr:DUF3467 domain-containing protein [Patescibacteria group bacterium]MDD4610779.1 DUF3467 domain-containing protein [Patescibacteria group bacterium]